MKRMRASITVEAAIIVPLVLFVFGLSMRSGIQLYLEFKDTVFEIMEDETMDAVQKFYQLNMLGDIGEDED